MAACLPTFLVAAIRPFVLKELSGVFAIDFGPGATPNFMEGWRPENPEESLLFTCSGLIAVVEEKGPNFVPLSHFSVNKFLISDRLRTLVFRNIFSFHIPLDTANTIPARACLTVPLKLDEAIVERHLTMFPLAFYSTLLSTGSLMPNLGTLYLESEMSSNGCST